MSIALRARGAELIRVRDYAGLRAWLKSADRARLARGWARLEPLHKLVAFKLLDAASAMEFYRVLPFREKYFLLSGFPLDAIAPVLESAPAAARRQFVRLPAEFAALMFRELARGAEHRMSNAKA